MPSLLGYGGASKGVGQYGSNPNQGSASRGEGGAGGYSPKLPDFKSLFGGGGGGGGITKPLSGFGDFKLTRAGVTSSGGGGSQPSGGFMGNPMLNTAQKDPRIEDASNKLNQRYQQLQSQEGQQDPFLMESVNNLRDRMSADTTARAIDRATTGAGDFSAAMQEKARAGGQRMGRGEDFGSAGIDAAAQRLQAGQAANISLGREKDLDALALGGHNILAAPGGYKLAQQGMTNNMLGQLTGFAPTGAQLALQQQGLGLEQWKAGDESAYRKALLQQQGQSSQMDLYLKMLSAAGY